MESAFAFASSAKRAFSSACAFAIESCFAFSSAANLAFSSACAFAKESCFAFSSAAKRLFLQHLLSFWLLLLSVHPLLL